MLQRVKLEDMIQSGMHFGHSTREWNPRMAPYIYGERNGRHILDLVQTYYLLHKVLNFLEENAAQGKTFLFVGTKQQAAPLIAKTALACDSYYVNQRWLGGMLTNWRTIQKSLRKLQEYRQAEERGDADGGCLRRAAADREALRRAGDVPLHVRLHRARGGDGKGAGQGTAGDLLHLLRRALPAAAPRSVRPHAGGADWPRRRGCVAGEYRLDRRCLRHGQADEHPAHPRFAARGAGRVAGQGRIRA